MQPAPPPPLAAAWTRVLRAGALPPGVDAHSLYSAIRDRLTHPEWEVRLHALRVLADLLPLAGHALSFPFDQVVDNLGHGSPNVRKAALDALKVFCYHCEAAECAIGAILDKCSYENIRPQSADFDARTNVITGLILSIPSVIGILKRRSPKLDIFPVFATLGDKLLDAVHRDVALRSLIKMRRVCGPRDFIAYISRLDSNVQDKFRLLCEVYDEDSLDVFYGNRRAYPRDEHQLVKAGEVFSGNVINPIRLSTDSSSDDSSNIHIYRNGFSNSSKVIIETEIKFDSDTAITMTVLEENETETESERNAEGASEDDCDSSEQHALRYSDDGDSEDTDVVVKKVRFGGESVKIRTPDSENQCTASEDDNKSSNTNAPDNLEQAASVPTPSIVAKANEIKKQTAPEALPKVKKSGIPLPVIQPKTRTNIAESVISKPNRIIKQKSKSLSELYDYFRAKNGGKRQDTGFSLTLTEVRSPEKIPSPVEPHREVEVLHNLQRSPNVSPRRRRSQVVISDDGFILNTVTVSLTAETPLLSPRPVSPLRGHYEWELLDILPPHVINQLHNKENWISAVKAADQLHSALLLEETVRRVEPAAQSLVAHMWALSDAVPSARAPCEGAVCALFRGCTDECARRLLPSLIPRLTRDPPPAALPHALLQRLALHDLVDLILDRDVNGLSGGEREVERGELAAALSLTRAAGPAAVLAALRRRLPGRPDFSQKLRDLLNRPVNANKYSHVSRSTHVSQLPVAVRGRARSTPPPPPPAPPRRLRPLPDSAPVAGYQTNSRDLLKTTTTARQITRNSSAATVEAGEVNNGDVKLQHEQTIIDIPICGTPDNPDPPHSPSIHVEELSDYEADRDEEVKHPVAESPPPPPPENSHEIQPEDAPFGSHKPIDVVSITPPPRFRNRRSSPSPMRSAKSNVSSPVKSGYSSPVSVRSEVEEERDVRRALAECAMPPRHEAWELIVSGLREIARLAQDRGARAPAAAWRAAARAAAAHVRSLRSQVARAACSTLGDLFEHRGRTLDPELEDCVAALLERCADVNRFLRGDAAAALERVAAGGGTARAVAALGRRGAGHRAGGARAAAAAALAGLARRRGAARLLDLAPEPRALLLRAAGDLLADAGQDARRHARDLCLQLANDPRFRPLLQDAMQPSRYRAIEKYIEKLHIR